MFLLKSQQSQILIRHGHFLFNKAYDKKSIPNSIVSICQVQGILKFKTPWIYTLCIIITKRIFSPGRLFLTLISVMSSRYPIY